MDEVLDGRLADELLRRQALLQQQAAQVLADLDLLTVLSHAGDVRPVGSFVTGLMVQPDIDLGVMCDVWQADAIFETVRPLASHPRVRRLSYDNQTGPFNPGFPTDGYYWGVDYGVPPAVRWKLDLWFWSRSAPSDDAEHTADVARRLTPETRVAILWIKDAHQLLQRYGAHDVRSIDVYDAVLNHGVRTPSQFSAFLAGRR